MSSNKWPKILAPLTPEQQIINDDFLQQWHEELGTKALYNMIENFNHMYSIKNTLKPFLTTLEIGAGIGGHLRYEKLTPEQTKNYVALELREQMASEIRNRYPNITVQTADCQKTLPFSEHYFDRILAIHVLEHLPNLPATIKEMHKVCHPQGFLSVVIPCEGGFLYSLGRKISAQRIFEKRYKQSYKWFIEREHINRPKEIIEELSYYFEIKHRSFFPFHIPLLHLNLCMGLTLIPKNKLCQ